MLSLSLAGQELLHGNRIRREINESMTAGEKAEKAESVTEINASGSESGNTAVGGSDSGNKAVGGAMNATNTGDDEPDSSKKVFGQDDSGKNEFKQGQMQQNLALSETKVDAPIEKVKMSENNDTETMGGDSKSEAKPVVDEGASQNTTSGGKKLEQAGDQAAEVDSKNSTITSPASVEKAVNDVTEKSPLDEEVKGGNNATADKPLVDGQAGDDAQREPVESTTANSTVDGEFVCGGVRPFDVL